MARLAQYLEVVSLTEYCVNHRVPAYESHFWVDYRGNVVYLYILGREGLITCGTGVMFGKPARFNIHKLSYACIV